MRICIVYDCLYPWTVGGAERWLRLLAERLAGRGDEVTFLTRRQWDDEDVPDIPGVRVIAVSPRAELYGPRGQRRIGPPLRFGLGVLRHLLRHRSSYDVVHAGAFPYFSLLAARAALAGTPTRLGIDWFEVWSRHYWRTYLGGAAGAVGWAVQRLCVRLTPRAFVFSRLHAERLVEEGLRRPPVLLRGLYDGDPSAPRADRSNGGTPLVVFAGRHIPEKRVPVIPSAVALARRRVPALRGLVLGDGPERERLLAAIDEAGAAGYVEAPGFVSVDAVDDAISGAACLLLPSSREGYGMVVIEAAAGGTPSVVVPGEDNAAVELIEDGVNGFVARSAEPADIADALVRCIEGGPALRRSTAAWFALHAPGLTIGSSVDAVAREYAR